MMKARIVQTLAALMFGVLGTAQGGSNILWDITQPGDANSIDATVADFVAAGVTEDLSGSTVTIVGGLAGSGQEMYDVTSNVGLQLVDAGGRGVSVNGATMTGAGAAIIKEYVFLDGNRAGQEGPITMRIAGLSGQLDPSTDYFLYIWGMGDNANQNSTFTFGGVTNTVSSADPDNNPASDYMAKFSFTTDAVVVDTLDFVWARNGRYAGLNGFAIVADVAAPIFPPTGVNANPGFKSIELSWDAEATAASYSIYRSTNNVDFAQIESNVNVIEYTDTNLVVDTTYYYYLTSVSNMLESPPSVTVSSFAYDPANFLSGFLWDFEAHRGGGDGADYTPPTLLAFSQAGIIDDITDLTPQTISYSGGSSSISDGKVTLSSLTAMNSYSHTAPANSLLHNYLYVQDERVMTVSGLKTVLKANTDYNFYLWGTGDNPGQNSTFTFPTNGVAQTTSATADPDVASITNFTVQFSFTTGDPVDDSFEFLWATNQTVFAGLNAIAIVTSNPVAVLPPTELEATGGPSQIDLTWAADAGADSYSIYRSTNGVDFAQLDSGIIGTNYTDSTVQIYIPYYYYLTSVAGASESIGSPIVSAVAYDGSDTTPPVLADFTAVQAGGWAVVMTWTGNAEPDLDAYVVQRALTADGIYTNIGMTTSTNFVDTHGELRSGVYDYKVTASDLAGNSTTSTVVTVDMTERYILEYHLFSNDGNPSNNTPADWLDATPNGGNTGRTENTGDIDGGRNLGWTDAGEWTTHQVNLQSGWYRLDMRSSVNNGSNLIVDVSFQQDTNTIYGTLIIPDTGGYQNWQTTSHLIEFPVGGTQTLQLTWRTGSHNLNWFELTHLGAEISAADLEGQDLVLAWDAELYKDYTVQESSDLRAGEPGWMPIPGMTNLPGVAGPMQVTAVATRVRSAYRVAWSDSPASALYEWDMEDGAPGWATNVVPVAGTAWELGTPTSGPNAANSGTNCWGTNLGAAYGTFATNVTLRTPEIDISGVPQATLHFWQFMDIDTENIPENLDWGTINVLDTNLVVTAQIFQEREVSTEWHERAITLPASTEPIILEFHFTSDDWNTSQAGWYIDDVSVTSP